MPLLDETEALMRTITRGSSPWVFPVQSALTCDPNKRATHSTYFGRILRRLGIEGKSFHCLRHTFASRRAAHGDTIDEIRIKMGHTSTVTTEGYVHPK
jgi:integrase